MGLGDTIKEGNESSNQDKAKAMIFLRHLLHEGLKTEYLTIKYPLTLWEYLNEREKAFQKYSKLISCRLVAEQNNELLMKNHEACPKGFTQLPEVNVTISYHHGRGHGQSRNNHSHGGYNHNSSNYKSHQKWNNDEEKKEKDKSGQHKNSKNT
ncbi:hypothetical protein Pint_27441 [Pistacia integerrima]|uniref:Uncharacterized protein n=1 Tax=Pistacia integerrima TaxID=434235 RepID=A0ACC0YSL9_9ROSI|nr:hypothetical protein Pint_27441 [Pistacia integerrima]